MLLPFLVFLVFALFSHHTMAAVLPGEQVPAQHVNLKLGPGLRQEEGSGKIVATKAGTVHHSPNNARWWVDANSRRVGAMRPL